MLNFLAAIAGNGGGGGGSFESIATATGTGSSATITFSSIPSTYQHLQIRYIGRLTAAYDFFNDAVIYVNGVNTGTNYSYHYLRGTGSAAEAGGAANLPTGYIVRGVSGANITSNIMGVGIIDIHDYASTTKNKTIRALSGGDSNSSSNFAAVALTSVLYRSTDAITSITLQTDGGNWTTNSTFALYGIKGA